MAKLQPFHLAVAVSDLREARIFYRDILGFEEGRSAAHWVDFNFYGHQLVIHESRDSEIAPLAYSQVDGKSVPVPHYGVVLAWEDWEQLALHLEAEGVEFVIEPYIRFEGEVGEQATMFFLDPSGNALEFKAFKNEELLFVG